MRRDETRLQYIQRLLRPSASKGTKHRKKHCQHASSVEANSQNRVAMTQPRYHTQTSYILTVSLQPHCLLERSSVPHFSCSTQKQGQVDSDVTVTVQTPMTTDRNKAYSTHSR